MTDVTMLPTVPAAAVAELQPMHETPKPAAAIVGMLNIGGRLIPMAADHALDVVSLGVAALARQGLEESGLILE